MKAPTYAAGTVVTVEKSKAELDGLLGKHGATSRGILHDEEAGIAAVVFVLAGRKYKLGIPMPVKPTAAEITKRFQGAWNWTPERKEQCATKVHDQAVRERWRGLVLLTKAKLEIVRMGGSTFEREFLADLVLPNGRTAGEELGEYMQNLLANGYTAPLALPEAT